MLGCIHGSVRDDKFPAGSHYVIVCVFFGIAFPYKSRNDDIIIAVLGETQPYLVRREPKVDVGSTRMLILGIISFNS